MVQKSPTASKQNFTVGYKECLQNFVSRKSLCVKYTENVCSIQLKIDHVESNILCILFAS